MTSIFLLSNLDMASYWL